MEQYFTYANNFAMTGWAALIAAMFIKSSRKAVMTYASLVAPGLLAIVYVYLLATAKGASGGFACSGRGRLHESHQQRHCSLSYHLGLCV